MKSKRTTIQVETYEVTTVRRRPSTLRAWCVACAAEVEMLTPERAAEWAAVPSWTVSRWLEAGKLHVAEIPPGLPYVCLNSLKQQMRELEVLKNVKSHPRLDQKSRPGGNKSEFKGGLP